MTILLIVLILLLIGAIPQWDYNRHWEYAPTGGLTTLLIIVFDLMAIRSYLGNLQIQRGKSSS